MANTHPNRTTRSERLLKVLSPFERFVIVMHDNPDPDAIAAGWAVRVLIRERLGHTARLVGGGGIVRAENRHMVSLLGPPVELVDRITADRATAPILVDCASDSTNHLLKRAGVPPVAVIDHHIESGSIVKPTFRDVRPKVVASATIAASYLREQLVEPGSRLATAMLYAMRTETRGVEAPYSRLDRSVVSWLTPRADPAIVAAIENAPLSRAYFADLTLAVQSTFLFEDAAWCFLPRADGPEIVGEVADLLVRCDGVSRVLCAAVIGRDALLSSRSGKQETSAASLLHNTLDGIGAGGGHAHRAGGKIPDVLRPGRGEEWLESELRRRWRKVCGIRVKRGVRLVAKREVLNKL